MNLKFNGVARRDGSFPAFEVDGNEYKVGDDGLVVVDTAHADYLIGTGNFVTAEINDGPFNANESANADSLTPAEKRAATMAAKKAK